MIRIKCVKLSLLNKYEMVNDILISILHLATYQYFKAKTNKYIANKKIIHITTRK